jgi:hypothetical protein
MSDGVVSDRFQTRGDNELSSHGTKEYLGERTVSSLNTTGSRYADVIRVFLRLECRMKLSKWITAFEQLMVPPSLKLQRDKKDQPIGLRVAFATRGPVR